MKLSLSNIAESINRDMFEGFNETELTEEYPKDFDLEEFKNLRSYAKKLNYAKSFLGKPIGTGSSRVVYRVDENKVLKLAKNQKGVAQNECEINWYGESYYDDIIAEVFDYDRDNSFWVEMELAYRTKKKDFERLWGVKLEDIWYYLRNWEKENRGRRPLFAIDPEIKEKLDENDEVQKLASFMQDSDLVAGDLGRISSWGIVHRGGNEFLVLIDFGCTNCVYNSYYC